MSGSIVARDPDDEAATEIGAQRARWVSAINAGSPDEFVAVLAPDAVWLPPGSPAISGKDAIREWLETPLRLYEYDYTIRDVKLRVAGDWAVEKASFRTEATTGSGEAMPAHTGTYVVLWRRSAAGAWLIERYIDESAPFVDVV